MISVIKNPYKSIQVETDEGKVITIQEGNKISFIVELSGEMVTGVVTKFFSKDEKLKVQIFSLEQTCEQIWSVALMLEGSLKLVEDE